MRCQHCGAEAPTRHVVFSQNIGLFFARFPSSVEGAFCKRCIHRLFWKMTLTSLVAGWWGIISFFTNIHFILGNISTYIQCLSMPTGGGSPKDLKGRDDSTSFSTERMAQFKDEIAQLLAAGEPTAAVCEKIARRANVPESDILGYINEHIRRPTAS